MSTDLSTILSRRMTRRSAVRALAGASAAALAVATVGVTAANHTAQLYTVSANANFRTGPGTGYSIIAVIPKGNTFTITGQTQNDYAGVNYQGRTGWVYASLIVGASSDPVIVGEGRTTASVNLRSGPSTSHQVLRVVPANTWVQTSETVQNGFRYVVHDGLAGWMADQYIDWPRDAPSDDQGDNYRTASARLNLRAEPNSTSTVLAVIPTGGRVQLLHTSANGYANVNYNGKQGWALEAYLS